MDHLPSTHLPKPHRQSVLLQHTTMSSSNVYRKESTRWVAPKTSYDGDDWGDDGYEDDWDAEAQDAPLAGIQEDEEADTHSQGQNTAHLQSQPSLRQQNSLKSQNSKRKTQLSRENTRKPVPTSYTKTEDMAHSKPHETPSHIQQQPQVHQQAPQVEQVPNETSAYSSEPEHQNKYENHGGYEPQNEYEHQSEPQYQAYSDAGGAYSNDGEAYANEGEGEGEASSNEGDDQSIQDIYGFYENRYSTQSFANPERGYSDSTASISTGARSFDSHDMRQDTQWENSGRTDSLANTQHSQRTGHRDISGSTVDSQNSHHSQYSQNLHQSNHPNVYQTGYQTEYQNEPQDQTYTQSQSEPNELKQQDQADDLPAAYKPQSDEQQYNPSSQHPYSAVESGHAAQSSVDSDASSSSRKTVSNNLRPTTLHERPYSGVFDEDLADLYTGSQEFLNRPISTYQAPQMTQDISSDSIRELLTPRVQQEGFGDAPAHLSQNESTPTEANSTRELSSNHLAPEVPSFVVTHASPEKEVQDASHTHGVSEDVRNLDLKDDNSSGSTVEPLSVNHSRNNSGQSGNSTISSPASPTPRDFSRDFDYMDKDPEGGESGSSSDDEDHEGNASVEKAVSTPSVTAKEFFMLPSESNAQQQSETRSTDASSREIDSGEASHSNELENESTSTDNRSSAPSSSPFIGQDSPVSHLSSDGVSKSSTSHKSNGSMSSAPGQGSGPGHRTTPSQSSALTGPPITARGPVQISGNGSSMAGSGSKSSAETQKQTIASKVKRPPHFDFGALMNNSNVSSETLCEQMRLLRNREAAYSAGLETWLIATLQHVDPEVRVYTNGIPPAGDSTLLDIPTAAKMSNAMHTSATKTQEKLGNLGEKGKSFGTKSKSFFAKVIR